MTLCSLVLKLGFNPFQFLTCASETFLGWALIRTWAFNVRKYLCLYYSIYTLIQWNVIMCANVTFPLTLVSKNWTCHFSQCYFNGIKIGTAFKCIFEEMVLKLSVNFGNRNSQDSQEPISQPCLEFWFYRTTIQWQILIKFAAEVPYLYHW